MTSPRAAWAFLAPILLAAALRLPSLGDRPMHADEAVNADKFGTLLEGGGYRYDPSEYHGPTLYYLTLLPARLAGERRYVDLDETTLRFVPAMLGVALVAAHLGAAASLGTPAALVAATLAALSPAFVFYSRDYIHETPLALFTLGALLGILAYLRRPTTAAALAVGACLGLALATKETIALAVGAMAGALALTAYAERREGSTAPFVVEGRHVAMAALAALGVAALLVTSFLTQPRGIVDAVRSYGIYAGRAGAGSIHAHPWYYYVGLLAHVPADGTPFWTEGLILVLAVVGGLTPWAETTPQGADARGVRFVALYTVLLLVEYSAIPYKTPWCVLGILSGLVLLAGVGAVALVTAFRGVVARGLVAVAVCAGALHLGFQAFAASFRFPADPRNPYVYAQTTADVYSIVDRLKDLARAEDEGTGLSVQIISRHNLWPLPWYLRDFPNVEWWNGVSDDATTASAILLTPEMEPAIVRRLYEVPPPGERELYVSLFDRPLELRPGVEVRGYVRSALWEKVR